MPHITDKERQEMIEHYERGLSLRVIAGFYFRSHESVRKVLLREGVKLKPPHRHYMEERH